MGRLERAYGADVREIIAKYPDGRHASAVVELLYLAQAAYGFLTPGAIDEVAEILVMAPTEVWGLVGFYSLLRDDPHGGYVVHICTDLPCALRGADEMKAVLVEVLGCEVGGSSDDGLFSLHECMCLGACDRAPVMQVNLEYVYQLSRERLVELVDGLRRLAEDDPPRRPPIGFGPPSEVGNGRGGAG